MQYIAFMHANAESIDDLLELLEAYPTIRAGGTIESCEMTRT